MNEESYGNQVMFTKEDVDDITEAICTILKSKDYPIQDKLFSEEDLADIAEAVCAMLFDESRFLDVLDKDEQDYFLKTVGVLIDIRRKIYKINGQTSMISVFLSANGSICLDFSLDCTKNHPNFPDSLLYSIHPVPPMTATALDAIVQKVIVIAQNGR